MKTFTSLILFIFLLIIACDETKATNDGDEMIDDELPILGQKPLLSFINLDSIGPNNSQFVYVNSGAYEFGTRMKFMKSGTLDGIGIQMPDSGFYRLTIWALADTSILLTDSILVDSGEVKYQSITSIPVQANDEIRITVQSDDWYWYNHVDDQSLIFPDTIADIILIDYSYISGSAQTYPTSINYDYYAGHADIVFNPDTTIVH